MYHLYQYGIEIKIASMKNDGSQSWTVISRGMKKLLSIKTLKWFCVRKLQLHVRLPNLLWVKQGRSNAMIIISVEPVHGDLWRTRDRWNLKLTSESKVFHILQSSKMKTIVYD